LRAAELRCELTNRTEDEDGEQCFRFHVVVLLVSVWFGLKNQQVGDCRATSLVREVVELF
jgi:hypothetical protein